MSDMTLGYLAARPAMEQREPSKFGLIALIVLALASTAVGIGNPTAIAAEYQIDTATSTGS